MKRRDFIAAFGGVAASAVLRPGMARSDEAFPTRTVRLILPFNPGSATDTTARLFADRLTARWGKPVVVENRPGGDGLVSVKAFIDAHDDHTFFFGPAATFLIHLYDENPPSYDTQRDIVPVVGIYVTVLAVSVPTSLGVNSIGELIAMARSEPGKLNVAAATGNSDFLIFGFFKSLGLQVTRVPYRDIMQAPGDLAENRIQVLSSSLAAAQPMQQSGRIKVLIVTSRQRAQGAPEIPTAAEAGYPALTMETAGGLCGSAALSAGLRDRIAADWRSVAETDPLIAKRLTDTGQIMTLRGPADYAASIKEQSDQLGALAKVLGMKTTQ